MTRRLLLLLMLAVACNRATEAPAPAPAAPKPGPKAETAARENLLDIAHGAAVVSRTGESFLEASALHAIDGMRITSWVSPPGGATQTLVYSLAAPSRINRLGIDPPGADQRPAQIRFEASADGTTWREVLLLDVAKEQTRDLPPFDARYLRITILEPSRYYSAVPSFIANGSETGPVAQQSFDGCWTINTLQARLVQRGARVFGTIGKTFVDGATDGRVARLEWRRGPLWGFAVATLSPDGNHISAATFFQEPLTGNTGEAWIGSRCTDELPVPHVPQFAGTYFGLAGETMDALAERIRSGSSQRFQLSAHEFRYADAQERSAAEIRRLRAALQQRNIDLSRIEFVAAGNTRKDAEPESPLQRLLWSRIDLFGR